MIGNGGTAPVKDRPSACKQTFAFTAPLGLDNPMTHMLDSLVRVSRRVTASADLLGREGPTATEALLAVQVGHYACRVRSRDTGC